MRVAVIGGGIFGCTAAVHLSRAGHHVELFEAGSHLMQCASAVNQFRLHRGYHYPRSSETVVECRAGEASFRQEYGEAVIDGGTQCYAVRSVASGGRTSAKDYLKFLEANDLPWRNDPAKGVWHDMGIDLRIAVDEPHIDGAKLTEIVWARLVEVGVTIRLSTPVTSPSFRKEWDRIVIAAYASTNLVAMTLGFLGERYQFEVVEKPVVRWDNGGDRSYVVMDGPFGCIDPYGTSGLYVMGHVRHALHEWNTSRLPEVPAHLKDYLNRGIVENPQGSRFLAMRSAMEVSIPSIRAVQHIGSMFTVRAVLPNRDNTDARPTMVEQLDEQVIRIFSGKIGTCVEAARQVVTLCEAERMAA